MLLLFTSCAKLDVVPPDQLSTTGFWKSPNDADLALAGLYNFLYSSSNCGWGYGQYEVMFWDNFSDDGYSSDDYGGGNTACHSGLTPLTGQFQSAYYDNCYQMIAACNSFLANVDKVLSGTQLSQYKAEAYFLRGFNYYWLAILYGNVPIVTADPMTIPASTKMATSPRTDVLAQVESDLNAAIANLPDVAYSSGHAVKSTAEGYLVRTYLFEKKWAQAATLSNAIISSGLYSLNPNYAYNFYKPEQNSSNEIMFSVKYLLPNLQHPYVALAVSLDSWSELQGTQDLINEYETGDPRKTMTWFMPGDTKAQGWPWDGSSSVYTPGYSGAYYCTAGFYMQKKWLTPGITDPVYGTLDDNDIVLLRYADIKLMYAEAQNEAVGADASVYQQVNDVRARVGMSPLAAGLSQTAMRAAIWHERRVEFAAEGLRYFDLRRWGITAQKLNGVAKNPLTPSITSVYKSNYDYWPIPQGEIDRNAPVMEQNPGY